MKVTVAALGFMMVNFVHGDMYLHNPRGSNNRLNEDKTARTNANRLFDSQVSIKVFLSFIDIIFSIYLLIFNFRI